MKKTKLLIIPLIALLLVLTGCGSKKEEGNTGTNTGTNNLPVGTESYLFCSLKSNDGLSNKEVTFVFNANSDYVEKESLKETYNISAMYTVYGDQCGVSEAACGEYVKGTINSRCGDSTSGVTNCNLKDENGTLTLTYDMDPYVDLVNSGILSSLSVRKDDLKTILVNANFSCY